jgi:hypothetical protein
VDGDLLAGGGGDKMKGWMIVNVTNEIFNISHSHLDPNDRPSYIHYSREAAEEELIRIKKKNPSDEFMLFESTKIAGIRYCGIKIDDPQSIPIVNLEDIED